jgi:hypothetical protein
VGGGRHLQELQDRRRRRLPGAAHEITQRPGVNLFPRALSDFR